MSMHPRTAQLLLILALLLAGCTVPFQPPPTATQPYPDRQAQSKQLKVRMTEAEVVAILGEPPNTAVSTCGRTFHDPWPCKKWPYSGGRVGNNLEVTFRNMSGKDWTVSSWRIY